MKSKLLNVRLFNILACVLILVTIALLFMPCWLHDGNSISISDYVWFPTEKVQKAFTAYLKTTYKAYGQEYNINDVVTAPVALMLMGLISLVLTVLKRGRSLLACVLLFGTGVVALAGFAGCLLYMWGSLYVPLLVCCGLTAAAGLAGIVVHFLTKKK